MRIKVSQFINNLSAKWYHERLLNGRDEEASAAQYYLYQRGINDTVIKEWGIGFAPDDWSIMTNFLKENDYNDLEIRQSGMSCKAAKSNRYFDRFRGRIMFPIKDVTGQVVGFTGRTLKEYDNDIKVAKYLNSPDSELFNKSEAIFGIEKAIDSIPVKDCIIIMEGQFDVITAHRHGITNAVACSGTALTVEHLEIIKKYTKNAVVCFDNDEAGKNASYKAIMTGKSIGMDIEVIKISDAGDPDELLRKDKDGLRVVYAQDGEDYLISKFQKERDSFLLLNYLHNLKPKEQDSFLGRLERKCT